MKKTIAPKDPILTILPTRKGDGKIVEKFVRKLEAFHGDKKGASKAPYFEKYFRGAKPLAEAWLAFADEKPVGLMISFDRPVFTEGTVLTTIEALYVEEKFRGAGIGECLIAVAAREALSRKCDSLHIAARFENKKANAYYKQLGFTLTTRKKKTNSYKADVKAMKKIAGK